MISRTIKKKNLIHFNKIYQPVHKYQQIRYKELQIYVLQMGFVFNLYMIDAKIKIVYICMMLLK